jgi:hypothetical protein
LDQSRELGPLMTIARRAAADLYRLAAELGHLREGIV